MLKQLVTCAIAVLLNYAAFKFDGHVLQRNRRAAAVAVGCAALIALVSIGIDTWRSSDHLRAAFAWCCVAFFCVAFICGVFAVANLNSPSERDRHVARINLVIAVISLVGLIVTGIGLRST